ncbi:hypothetical protein BN8_05247 [Fibrisoma limi BUZ 3]|uniref:Uncharacterized protein n=1 Tax=Fibrisoma limi BUZ 3 TaxID=1185876 RepID=I2GPW9_9BACT|nr:LPXTG cell wall anchor domain-containing protein [Fibrisoma limi]CCH55947.1 hypothetical protein BN8_05247 [Fibrisoma limi BUZ 3]
METSEQTSSGTMTALIIGLVLLLGGGIYFWNKSRNLAARSDRTEQQADSLLAVKLRLDNDMRVLNEQLATAKEDNTELNRRMEMADSQLNRTNASLRELRRSNIGRTRTIENLNREVEQLTVTRDSLTTQTGALQDKINWQNQSNELLINQQKELQDKVTALDARIVTMVPRSSLTGDGFRVEAVKPNDKVTAKAKKTDALTISLNIPAEMRLEGLEEVYLSLTNDRQQAAIPPLRTETIALSDKNEVIPVHAVQNVNFAKTPMRVSFRLEPDADIQPGTYRASVYTNDRYLGSVEFQLRDSFWFF